MTRQYRFNERDERGWRIPRNGTVARTIYGHMLAALAAGHDPDIYAIAEELGRRPNYVSVNIWKIKNPAKSNSYGHIKRDDADMRWLATKEEARL